VNLQTNTNLFDMFNSSPRPELRSGRGTIGFAFPDDASQEQTSDFSSVWQQAGTLSPQTSSQGSPIKTDLVALAETLFSDADAISEEIAPSGLGKKESDGKVGQKSQASSEGQLLTGLFINPETGGSLLPTKAASDGSKKGTHSAHFVRGTKKFAKEIQSGINPLAWPCVGTFSSATEPVPLPLLPTEPASGISSNSVNAASIPTGLTTSEQSVISVLKALNSTGAVHPGNVGNLSPQFLTTGANPLLLELAKMSASRSGAAEKTDSPKSQSLSVNKLMQSASSVPIADNEIVSTSNAGTMPADSNPVVLNPASPLQVSEQISPEQSKSVAENDSLSSMLFMGDHSRRDSALTVGMFLNHSHSGFSTVVQTVIHADRYDATGALQGTKPSDVKVTASAGHPSSSDPQMAIETAAVLPGNQPSADLSPSVQEDRKTAKSFPGITKTSSVPADELFPRPAERKLSSGSPSAPALERRREIPVGESTVLPINLSTGEETASVSTEFSSEGLKPWGRTSKQDKPASALKGGDQSSAAEPRQLHSPDRMDAADLSGPGEFKTHLEQKTIDQIVSTTVVESRMVEHDGDQQFHMRLDPPDLGGLTVNIHRGRDGHVSLHLSAASAETHSLLEQHAGEITQALQDQGLSFSQFDLSHQHHGHSSSDFPSYQEQLENSRLEREARENFSENNPTPGTTKTDRFSFRA